MMDYKRHEWQPFFIEDVAEIVSGKDIYERERKEGFIPYVTATANNNGIGYFVGNSNETLERNCLSVNRNGSVGYCFYHPYAALYGNDTRKLRPKINNKYVALFLSWCITMQREKYGYGYKMGTGRLKRQRILLPVNSNSEPDWEFMETFMREKEQKLLKPIIDKLCIRLIHNEISGGGNSIHPNWKPFPLSEIFTILPGKRLTKSDMTDGSRPFIGASDSNNGVTAWVSNTNESLDSNVLGVNYNGSVCETFFHPYECIFSDDVKRLHLKSGVDSKYVMLFLKTIILQQKCKYEYGYKFNEQRMLRQTILLPVDSSGNPDWHFMEMFMRKLETQMLETTIEIFKNRINVNKCKLGGGKMEADFS